MQMRSRGGPTHLPGAHVPKGAENKQRPTQRSELVATGSGLWMESVAT